MDEEINVLQAIYGDELIFIPHTGWYSIQLNPYSNNNNNKLDIWFEFYLHKDYPNCKVPSFRFRSLLLSEEQENNILNKIKKELFIENECCMFGIISWLMNDLLEYLDINIDKYINNKEDEKEEKEEENIKDINIIHGESIIDRKSKFIAHIAEISNNSQVYYVLKKLKSNSKIAKATHNIYAYRILLPNGTIDSFRDDDGESGAGDKLLDLLDKCNVTNIIVIVTRWYGGIHLGNDRFKHINERALHILKENGYINK